MTKIEALKTPPFALPIRVVDVNVIVAHDLELVCHTDGATYRELAHITDAVNMLPTLLEIVDLLEDLAAYAESATLEEDDLPECVVEAQGLLRKLKGG